MALSLLAIFLPVGARYSMDRAMDPEPDDAPVVVSIATVALIGQVLWFFGSAGLGRLLPLATEAGDDAGFDAASSWVVAVGLIPLLPSLLFDRLSWWAAATHRAGLCIYYDRDCGFCRKICLLFRTFLLLGNTPILPIQDDPRAFAIMQEHNTWVVFDHDGKSYVRWHAVLLLLRRSLVFRPLGLALTTIGMGRWCDWLYGAIAASRGWWSSITRVVLPYRHIDPDLDIASRLLVAV